MSLNNWLFSARSNIVKRPFLAAILILFFGVFLGRVFQPSHGAASRSSASEEASASGEADHSAHEGHGADQATTWTCAMHPQIRSEKPGKCPLCGMELVPVQKQSTSGLRTLTISPEARALMNIETVPVERNYVSTEIRMVGKVDFDETKLGYITAWVGGRLDQLYVDFTGVEVNEGDHMVYIYSEELYAAQEELLQAIKYASQTSANSTRRGGGSIDLVESAREKLRLLGLTQEQIDRIESEGAPNSHLTIYSPVSGVVIEKLKQEGERVRLGERIYTVADLSLLWVHLDAYEADLPWIRYGQEVSITTEAYPGEELRGRIAFIQPVLSDKTRTVKVRVNVPNPDGRLKPEMFVSAIVRPKIAMGGRVMDPSLAGKWIGPMHPEIVKDAPGDCDICGMPLVRAESLGYVSAETDEKQPPLVIPYAATLVTGTRAIVYVELPTLPSGFDRSFQSLTDAMKGGDMAKIRETFKRFSQFLDRPYDQPATDYSRKLWDDFANRLSQDSLEGQRAQQVENAKQTLARLEKTVDELREQFSPSTETAFEGREIVLGPRAGDYFIVKHGLQEGELVAARGNFKIDAEIQIQAKPSMMTPEGGGGGGGHGGHGGSGTKKMSDGKKAMGPMTLPTAFLQQMETLSSAYGQVTQAVEASDLRQINSAFGQVGKALSRVDKSLLSGSARMQWKELAMLLGNDAVEGIDARQMRDADRVYLMLKGHMRQLRGKLGIPSERSRVVETLQVGMPFQMELAQLWKAYEPLQQALTEDNFSKAAEATKVFRTVFMSINDKLLEGHQRMAWEKERSVLTQQLGRMQVASDLESLRSAFAELSDEMGVLARSFGFGHVGEIYQLHCPMAFDGRGAIWLQSHSQTKNPYYGSAMLECSDRVELISPTAPNATDHKGHERHE